MTQSNELEDRTEEILHNLKYVYKTHYKMAEGYERRNNFMSFFVAIGTALLAGLLIWESAGENLILTIALIVAIVSWADAILDLGKKSEKHYRAADEYHDLYDEFKDFYNLELATSSSETDENKATYENLIQKRKNIKKSTPRTTNYWYNKLDHDAITESFNDEIENNQATV
ncbi:MULTISPECIES: SLATT domain-containing protein [Halorubrum]|uniref:SLATT domain-containing protein n=1 Tax=Halorubrum TaxID=56688 RepID=UPI0012673ABA|nr:MULTISPECIES: SLATT domain-containing protein [Halorubrum]